MPIQPRCIVSGNTIPPESLCISLQNRAFRYGDGIFETILVRKGRPVAIGLHLQRLGHGAATLGFDIQADALQQEAATLVDKLLKDQDASGWGRIRITVHREDGGHFLPASDHCLTIGEIHPIPSDPWLLRSPLTLSVAHPYPLAHGPLSACKTLSSLPYVMAARLARTQGTDDAILRHENGEVAELSAANLFLVIGDQLLTPRLESGCLPGTMRHRTITIARALGLKLREVAIALQQFASASEVFATNAIIGLQPVGEIAEAGYRATDFPILTQLRAALVTQP